MFQVFALKSTINDNGLWYPRYSDEQILEIPFNDQQKSFTAPLFQAPCHSTGVLRIESVFHVFLADDNNCACRWQMLLLFILLSTGIEQISH